MMGVKGNTEGSFSAAVAVSLKRRAATATARRTTLKDLTGVEWLGGMALTVDRGYCVSPIGAETSGRKAGAAGRPPCRLACMPERGLNFAGDP